MVANVETPHLTPLPELTPAQLVELSALRWRNYRDVASKLVRFVRVRGSLAALAKKGRKHVQHHD